MCISKKYEMGLMKLDSEEPWMVLALWEKQGFCNWTCNYMFQLQGPLGIHYKNLMLFVLDNSN